MDREIKSNKEKNIQEEIDLIKKHAARFAISVGALFAMNFLPIEQKPKIFDPLVDTRKLEFLKSVKADTVKQELKLLKLDVLGEDLSIRLKKLEEFADVKIRFPKSSSNGKEVFIQVDDLNYIGLERMVTELGIFNNMLPPDLRIKEILFYKAIFNEQENVYTQGRYTPVVSSISISTKFDILPDVIFHEISHLISQGLFIERGDKNPSFDVLLDFINEKKLSKPNGKSSDLDKIGLRDYSFKEGQVEVFSTLCELIATPPSRLSQELNIQRNKCLAFYALKQNLYGSTEFVNLVNKYVEKSKTIDSLSPQEVLDFYEQVRFDTLDLKEKLKNTPFEKDPNIQKEFTKLKQIEWGIDNRNLCKVILAVLLIISILNQTYECIAKTADLFNDYDATIEDS